MKAFVLISIRTGEVKEVVRQLKRIQSIQDVSMTFGPYDAVAIVQAKDLNDLGHIMASVIQPIPGIDETLTCLAVDI
jgi:DNA-binding Lrp family transcriptional regulator